MAKVFEAVNSFAAELPKHPPPVGTYVLPNCLEQLGNWRVLVTQSKYQLHRLDYALESLISKYMSQYSDAFPDGNNT